MTETRGERLRTARQKKFRSARAAAMALGVPVSTYGAHERAESPGGRDYGPEAARIYARHFEVEPDWLVMGGEQGAGPAAPTSAGPVYPIMGYVGAESIAHYYEVGQGYLDHALAPHSYPPSPAMAGLVCVAALKDGRVLVKKLLPGRAADTYDLASYFAPIMRDASIDWVARILTVAPPDAKIGWRGAQAMRRRT